MARTNIGTDVQLRKTDTIIDELEKLQREISDRAYRLFRDRAGAWGDALSDWLTAEHELIWKPPIEVRQQDGRIEVLTALPGVDARDIDVQVTPDDVLIKATVSHEHTAKDGEVQLCEFERGNAFRSIHLPSTIDTSSVKAEYRAGMLRVTAAAVKAATPQKVDVKAA